MVLAKQVRWYLWVWRNTYLLSVVGSGHVTQVGWLLHCCCYHVQIKARIRLLSSKQFIEHDFTQITCHSRVPNKSTIVLSVSALNKSIFNEGNFGRKVFSYQPDIQATPPPGNQTWAILRVRFYNIVKSTNLDCGLSARCCRRSEGSWLGLGGLYNVIRAGSVKNEGREVLVGGQLDLQRLTIFKSTPFAGHNTAKGGCTPNGEIFEFYVNLWKHTMHTCLIKYKKKWCVNC